MVRIKVALRQNEILIRLNKETIIIYFQTILKISPSLIDLRQNILNFFNLKQCSHITTVHKKIHKSIKLYRLRDKNPSWALLACHIICNIWDKISHTVTVGQKVS